MKILDHDSEGATVHLDMRELTAAMLLVQEGRAAINLWEPTGRALDELFKDAVELVAEDRKHTAAHSDQPDQLDLQESLVGQSVNQ
jgi:hypothetical protein